MLSGWSGNGNLIADEDTYFEKNEIPTAIKSAKTAVLKASERNEVKKHFHKVEVERLHKLGASKG